MHAHTTTTNLPNNKTQIPFPKKQSPIPLPCGRHWRGQVRRGRARGPGDEPGAQGALIFLLHLFICIHLRRVITKVHREALILDLKVNLKVTYFKMLLILMILNAFNFSDLNSFNFSDLNSFNFSD